MADAPVIFCRWEQLTGWLLQQTEKFPRKVRLTLSNRIDNLTLDVFEGLIEARYTRQRSPVLRRINLDLEKLRLLLRLAHSQRYIATNAFNFACREIDEVGRMIGGWLRQQEAL